MTDDELQAIRKRYQITPDLDSYARGWAKASIEDAKMLLAEVDRLRKLIEDREENIRERLDGDDYAGKW